jgi:hypothetical protein
MTIRNMENPMPAFDPTKHLTNLKGKDYLEVRWRLVWAREALPNLTIETEHVEITDQRAIFKATVYGSTYSDDNGDVAVRATGYGSETPKDFGDYIEKAETKALGRALGALGFGTQFTDDFDEGRDNPVDTPVTKPEAMDALRAGEVKGSHGLILYEPTDQEIAQGQRLARQTPKPQQTATNMPAIDADTSRMRRLHGIAKDRGLSHDELHAIAKGRGKDSLKELSPTEMDTFANWLEKVTPPMLQVAIDAGRETATAQ